MGNFFQKALGLLSDRPSPDLPEIEVGITADTTANLPAANLSESDDPVGAPAIKYQWVYNLTPANCQKFEPLTFPSLQKRWHVQQQRGHLGGVAAIVGGESVGLVLIELLSHQAEIISLFVAPEYRQKGIASQLLGYLDRGLRKLHCPKIYISYQVTELTEIALETLLHHQNWQLPKTDFLLTKTTIEEFKKAPWVYQYPLPEKFEVFPWFELTDGDRDHIRQNHNYPESLNPFTPDPRIEPINSLGLRYQGKVIGWTINHRIAKDTIRYSTMFVETKFQRMGRGFSLLTEAIKRQIESGIPYATTAVASDNQAMLDCANRHYKPYATYFSEARSSYKRIE